MSGDDHGARSRQDFRRWQESGIRRSQKRPDPRHPHWQALACTNGGARTDVNWSGRWQVSNCSKYRPTAAGLSESLLQRPDLVVRNDDLTITARDVARIIAQSDQMFVRGRPAKVISSPDRSWPQVRPMIPDAVVNEAHELARPVKMEHDPRPVTLPHRVARLYLALDDWGLRPLKGITTAPLLSVDGSMRIAEGYDGPTAMWCCRVPALELPDAPSLADAEGALRSLRAAFCTFPFADARAVQGEESAIPLVDLSHPPGRDESAFLAALLTAVCRPSLPLAPGMVITAPLITGAGTGKGLLVRAVCEIAFGRAPYAFTACRHRAEMESESKLC